MKINAELVVAPRTKRTWSQDELSIASGLNLGTIQRIENESSASLQSKKALASVFGIHIRDLEYEEKPSVTKYEYKWVEMPFRFGVLKQSTPDIEKVLNAEGDQGWRLQNQTVRVWVVALLLFSCGAARAVDCAGQTVGGTPFTVCRVDLKSEELALFWRDAAGRPFRQFSALREALQPQGKQLVFAVNAGMYRPDFAPVGLFVAEGRELAPLNHHVGSGNFSQQPNGVFLVEGSSARVMTTDDYAKENPKPLLATQSGPILVHEGEITTSAVMHAASTSRKIRNGVCAPSPNAAVFVLSEAPVTFYEFAGYFRDTLHCQEALYLDGTISSLYVRAQSREDRGSDMGPILGVVTTASRQR